MKTIHMFKWHGIQKKRKKERWKLHPQAELNKMYKNLSELLFWRLTYKSSSSYLTIHKKGTEYHIQYHKLLLQSVKLTTELMWHFQGLHAYKDKEILLVHQCNWDNLIMANSFFFFLIDKQSNILEKAKKAACIQGVY